MTILFILLILIGAPDGTLDDDAYLHFEWEPASGNVDHYVVNARVNDGPFAIAGTTKTPAIMITHEPVGDKIVVQVQAVDGLGATGPMSPISEPVWRVVQKTPPRKPVSE